MHKQCPYLGSISKPAREHPLQICSCQADGLPSRCGLKPLVP